MATPALRALRQAHPAAEVVLEGRPVLAGLVAGLPSIDAFLPDRGGVWARTRSLRDPGFDWALGLPDSVRAALAPFLARIPVRVGYARDPARRILLTRSLELPSENGRRVPISMTERYLRLTRALGCADPEPGLELAVDPEARERVSRRLRESGVSDSDRLVVVTPGAAFGSSKLWPAHHFAAACDGIAEKLGLRAVLAPGPGEEPIAEAIARDTGSHALSLVDPPLGLAELVALIVGAALVLTNDTGPRHLAVALDRPVVVLMGPTDPRHTAHLLERQRVLREDVECSPCHLKVCPIDHRCLVRLRPERVILAAEELLS